MPCPYRSVKDFFSVLLWLTGGLRSCFLQANVDSNTMISLVRTGPGSITEA
jgi:hypothetical protein